MPKLSAAKKPAAPPPQTYEEKKRLDAEARRNKKVEDERNRRITELESRISEKEQAIKELEGQMAAPGFYDNRELSQAVLAKHHSLMWEVGDLMGQWEALQEHAAENGVSELDS